MVLLLFFVDFDSEGVVVIEEDAEEIVKVDLLVPPPDLVNVVGHDQVRQIYIPCTKLANGLNIHPC